MCPRLPSNGAWVSATVQGTQQSDCDSDNSACIWPSDIIKTLDDVDKLLDAERTVKLPGTFVSGFIKNYANRIRDSGGLVNAQDRNKLVTIIKRYSDKGDVDKDTASGLRELLSAGLSNFCFVLQTLPREKMPTDTGIAALQYTQRGGQPVVFGSRFISDNVCQDWKDLLTSSDIADPAEWQKLLGSYCASKQTAGKDSIASQVTPGITFECACETPTAQVPGTLLREAGWTDLAKSLPLDMNTLSNHTSDMKDLMLADLASRYLERTMFAQNPAPVDKYCWYKLCATHPIVFTSAAKRDVAHCPDVYCQVLINSDHVGKDVNIANNRFYVSCGKNGKSDCPAGMTQTTIDGPCVDISAASRRSDDGDGEASSSSADDTATPSESYSVIATFIRQYWIWIIVALVVVGIVVILIVLFLWSDDRDSAVKTNANKS